MNIKKLNKVHGYFPMDCPVCDEYYFSSPSKYMIQDYGEEEVYKDYLNDQCSVCGWKYDYEQTINPDLKDGRNDLSLNEYNKWFKNKRLENPQYDYSDEHRPPKEPFVCLICGKYTFEDNGDFDICPFCGWENDPVQTDDPDYAGGANVLSLNEHKKMYEKKIKENPNYCWEKDFDED